MLKKILAYLLMICMLFTLIPMAAIAEEGDSAPDLTKTSQGDEDENALTDYALFLDLLQQLEAVAAEYGAANDKDGYGLTLNYIRTGAEKYQDSLWAGVAGAMDTDFIDHVAAYDEENETTISMLRNLGNIIIPNGDSIEMVHLIAVMDIANYQSRNDPSIAMPYKDFGGWLGDLGDLIYQVFLGEVDCVTDFEAGVTEIRTNYLGVNLGRNSFDMQDIRGDLDAVYLMAKHEETEQPLSALFSEYYTTTLSDTDRTSFYLSNRYPGISAIAPLRSGVYNDYIDNLMAYALEGKRGINRSEYPERIKASCYAWADYICESVGITEFGEYPPEPEPEEPEPTDEPTPVDLDNDYYRVFSSETTTLVPGVTQTVKLAITADDKQMAYYIATADVNRDDVTVCAGYKDYNGNVWGMQSVTDQIAAAMAAHEGENFNVVVGTNADFFNMGTGEPTGILVMQGVEYHPVGREPFFAILDDGSAVIATKDEYANYSDRIQEAVGANTFLVRNGEIAVGHSSNYMNSRASRTCVGLTESGKVVLMVLDGRQEPWSCGGSAEEIAQIMLDAGCVTAVNLDGGGSTTYAAKLEGSDEVTVVNRPSDGFERRVSTSLMIVSSAVISNELDHVNLNVANSYMMLGTEMPINAVGVSVSGNSAELPEDPMWIVSDDSIGYMEGNVFVADDYGDVTVTMMDGETELGSIELHVVLPDTIAFDPAEFDAIYGAETPIPLTASYDNNDVALPTDADWLDSLIYFDVEKGDAGYAYGLTFYASDPDCGVRATKITAHLWEDDDITAEGTIRLYNADEASFDFNNCTGGDRILAWNRNVTNTTVTDGTYYLDDPNEEIVVEYTFALDMNDLVIPENIAQALPLVAAFMGEGQVNGDTTAWELLLMLAERISPSTTVTVTVNVDPRLELDLSEMMINCQFFTLTDTIYDEETNQLQLICNWIKVYGPIDPGTANPLCIVSGLKARLRDGVVWDENNEIEVVNSGSITYMARLRSSAAYSLADSDMGHQYGLVPYDNTANLVNDRGAEFSSTHTTFSDSFIINGTDNEGWVTTEDGSQFYYVNNRKLTGIQQVPDPENTGVFFYNFGGDGVSRGKYSGLFEMDGNLYYAVLGERKTAWRFIGDSYYYFNKQTFAAVDGEQVINGYHYTFEEYKLTRGELVRRGEYWKYMWAGSYYRNGWFILDGHKYCALPSEKLCTGLYRTDPYGGGDQVLQHIFGEDAIWHEEISGFYDHTDGATYLAENGIIIQYPGLVEVDGDLYYFASNNQMIKNRSYWITKTNGILPEKAYDFGPDGKMIRPDPGKNGFYEEEESIFYYELGVRAYAGLIHLDENTIYHAEDGTETGLADGYYYVRTSGEVVHGRSYWITKTNGIEGFSEGVYYFDDHGRMIDPPVSPDPTEPAEPTPIPTVKNGFYEEKDSLYYYVNGKLFYAGLIHLDENTIYHAADGTEFGLQDGYYYVKGTGEVIHGRSYWITKTNDIEGFREGAYTFDEHGCMVDPPVSPEPTEPTETPEPTPTPSVKNGFYEENDSLYYYVNGRTFYAGLIHLDENTIYHAADGTEFGLTDGYYYVRGTGEVVHGRSYWITKTNDIEGFKQGSYNFDEHGLITNPPMV